MVNTVIKRFSKHFLVESCSTYFMLLFQPTTLATRSSVAQWKSVVLTAMVWHLVFAPCTVNQSYGMFVAITAGHTTAIVNCENRLAF